MDLSDAVRRRRMVRSFTTDPVDTAVVDALLDLASRHPSADNSAGTAFLVLDDAADRATFWDLTVDPAWDRDAAWPGLRNAPVIVIPLASRQAYLDRYAEPDKIAVGRHLPEGWPVPYWLVDTAMATMTLLLAITDAGLGGLFFGIFHGRSAVLDHFRVPSDWNPIGAVAIGHIAADDRASRSVSQRPRAAKICRGSWHWGATSG